MAIKLRELTTAEQTAIEKLARSRTALAREVERVRIILLASVGTRVPAMAQELKLTQLTVRTWLSASMLKGLKVCRIGLALGDPSPTSQSRWLKSSRPR